MTPSVIIRQPQPKEPAMTLKFRAECQFDVARLILQIAESGRYCRIVDWESDDFESDCTVTVETSMSVDDLRELMRRVIDGHVMSETVAEASDYSGERIA